MNKNEFDDNNIISALEGDFLINYLNELNESKKFEKYFLIFQKKKKFFIKNILNF